MMTQLSVLFTVFTAACREVLGGGGGLLHIFNFMGNVYSFCIFCLQVCWKDFVGLKHTRTRE